MNMNEPLVKTHDSSLVDEEQVVHRNISDESTRATALNEADIIGKIGIIFKSGLPTSLAFLCSLATGVISIRYIGKYGTSTELAAATFGYTWANIVCAGIIISITQGFCVLMSHANGAKKYHDVGLLYQKNLCLLGFIMIPFLASLWFADQILIAIGLDYETSINTGIYLKCLTPSLISLAFFETAKCFLIAQEIFLPQAIIQGSFAFVHIFWCELLVEKWTTPIIGAVLAKSISDTSCAIVLWLYIKVSGACKETIIPWTRDCFRNLWYYLKESVLIGANIYIEMISYEFSMFVVSLLKDDKVLAANGITITTLDIMLMIPLGNSISMQSFIGNAAGEGSALKAKKFMQAGLILNLFVSATDILIMVFGRGAIGDFFTNDSEVKEYMELFLLTYAMFHVADTYVNHLSGVLRTIGFEKTVFLSFCFCWVGVAWNSEWVFCLVLKYGAIAVWFAMGFGLYLLLFILIRKLFVVDWGKEIAKIRENMIHESKDEISEDYIQVKE